MVSKHLASRATEHQSDSDGDSLYEVLQDHLHRINFDNLQWYAVEVDKMTRIDGNSEDDFSLSEVEEEEERNNGRAMEHRFRSARSLHVEVLLLFLENQA